MRDRLWGVLLLGVAAAVFASGCATGQTGVIWGSVIDNNNRAISGAMVTTDPPSSSVSTDNLGRYILRLEKAGTYSVTAMMLGYVSEPTLVQTQKGDVTQADLKLLPEGMAPVSRIVVPMLKEDPPAAAAVTTTTTEESPEVTTKPPKKKKWWEK